MNDRDLHQHLIGQQGGRRSLNTPVLVLDRERLAHNIARMAEFANAQGVRLRPHAKTHKSVDIAKLQIAAGADGVCCAKLGEAEALAEGGVESILLTSPVVSAPAIARLTQLNGRMRDLAVVVDHPANARALAAAAKRAGQRLAVLVDIDPGIRRTGVSSIEAAAELAKAIRADPSLSYRGVQFYCGMQQHIASFKDRREAIEERTGYLRAVIAGLKAVGAEPEIVTGGGTGTHRIDAELGALNELQVGSYVFMDRQYNDCDITGTGALLYETALFIDTRVVSANTPGLATIDAGFKAMATDGGSPMILEGAPEGATFRFMGDEHGAIIAPQHRFEISERVVLATPHCDPTVNLYDAYHVVEGETLIDIWPIAGRGRSR